MQNSRLLQELRNFRFEDVLLLTGTPLQNNTQELWTLLNFIHPDKFGYVSHLHVETISNIRRLILQIS